MENTYDCLETVLDWTKKHHVGVSTHCMGEELSEEVKPNSKSPWNNAFLKIGYDSPLSREQNSDAFRTLAMKGMLLVKRAR